MKFSTMKSATRVNAIIVIAAVVASLMLIIMRLSFVLLHLREMAVCLEEYHDPEDGAEDGGYRKGQVCNVCAYHAITITAPASGTRRHPA